jgi:hypothetical protein
MCDCSSSSSSYITILVDFLIPEEGEVYYVTLLFFDEETLLTHDIFDLHL